VIVPVPHDRAAPKARIIQEADVYLSVALGWVDEICSCQYEPFVEETARAEPWSAIVSGEANDDGAVVVRLHVDTP
jgi:hypothetical protein